MERVKPKLHLALVISLLYDLPRLYLNVHIFSSICSLYYNVMLNQHTARGLKDHTSHPRPLLHNELVPPYLLDYINRQQHNQYPFELQHSSLTIPFYHISPKCTWHLDAMRDSLAFQLYFVMSDCLIPLVAIIVITYSTLFFFLEIKKGHSFREAATGGGNVKHRRFWTFPRIAFLLNVLVIDAILIAQVCFIIYWLIIDVNGVFMIQIIRYMELFYFYSLTFYLVALSLIKMMQLNVLNE